MVFARRRPLLRAAAVGGGAYLAGQRRAQRQSDQQYQDADRDQRISNLEQQQQATVPAPRDSGGQPGLSVADQLGQLADLHKQGVLSDDEFAAAKAKLLGT
jgi:uncharacterized lipoprotein YmbA